MKLLKENGLEKNYKDGKIEVKDIKNNRIIKREHLSDKIFYEEISKPRKEYKIFDKMKPYKIYNGESFDGKRDIIYKMSFISNVINNVFERYQKRKPSLKKIKDNNINLSDKESLDEFYRQEQMYREAYWITKPKNLYIKVILISLIKKELCIKSKEKDLSEIISEVSREMLKNIKGYNEKDKDKNFLEGEVLSLFKMEEEGKYGKITLEEVISYSLKKEKIIKEREEIKVKKLTEIISNIIKCKKENKKIEDWVYFKEKIGKEQKNIVNSIYETSNSKKMKANEYWVKALNKECDFEIYLENAKLRIEEYLKKVVELTEEKKSKDALVKLFKQYATFYREITENENTNEEEIREKIYFNNMIYEGIKKCYEKSRDKKIKGKEKWNIRENIINFVIHNIRNKYMSFQLEVGKHKWVGGKQGQRLGSKEKIKIQIDNTLHEKVSNSIIFAGYHFSRMIEIDERIDVIGVNKGIEEELEKKIENYVERYRFKYPNIIGNFKFKNEEEFYKELLREQRNSIRSIRNKTFHRKGDVTSGTETKLDFTTKLCKKIIENYKYLKMKQLNSNNLIYIADSEKIKELFNKIEYKLEIYNNYFLSFNKIVTDKKMLLKIVKEVKFGEANFYSIFNIEDVDITNSNVQEETKTANGQKISAYKFILNEIYTEKFLKLKDKELEIYYKEALEELKDEKDSINGKEVYKFRDFSFKFKKIKLEEFKREIQKEVSIIQNDEQKIESDKLKKIRSLEKFEKYVMGISFIRYLKNSGISSVNLFRKEKYKEEKVEEINFNIELVGKINEIDPKVLDWFNLGLYLDKGRRNKLRGAINNYRIKNKKNYENRIDDEKLEGIIIMLNLVDLVPEIDYIQSEKYREEAKEDIQIFIPEIKEKNRLFRDKYKINPKEGRETFYLDNSDKENLEIQKSFEKVRKYRFDKIFIGKFNVEERHIEKYCEYFKELKKLKNIDTEWKKIAEVKQEFNNYSNIIFLDILSEAMEILNDIVEKYISWSRTLEVNIQYLVSRDKNKKCKDSLDLILSDENNLKKLGKVIKNIEIFEKLRNDFAHLTILRNSIWDERDPKQELNYKLKEFLYEKKYELKNSIQLIFSTEEQISVFEILTWLMTYDLKLRKGMYDSIQYIFEKKGYLIKFKTLENGRVIFSTLDSKKYKVLKDKSNPKGESIEIPINNHEKLELMKNLLNISTYKFDNEE